MLKIENVEVLGWEAAIRGMRNPMNSWEKSDSFCPTKSIENSTAKILDCDRCSDKDRCQITYLPFNSGPIYRSTGRIGPNDHELMMSLAKGGPVHAKYRRMITVYMDITAPLYWWKEFDTYKVSTVANSCSTMHKIHAKEFTLDDFSHEHLMTFWDQSIPYASNETAIYDFKATLECLIETLNAARRLFLETNDKKYWWQMIQLLPSSYNQRRTIMLNYEVLHNIYESRRNHKLDCWHTFCDWIEGLPYSEIIIGERTN